jgi:hypothetical protein
MELAAIPRRQPSDDKTPSEVSLPQKKLPIPSKKPTVEHDDGLVRKNRMKSGPSMHSAWDKESSQMDLARRGEAKGATHPLRSPAGCRECNLLYWRDLHLDRSIAAWNGWLAPCSLSRKVYICQVASFCEIQENGWP